jgi:hypothetical protein
LGHGAHLDAPAFNKICIGNVDSRIADHPKVVRVIRAKLLSLNRESPSKIQTQSKFASGFNRFPQAVAFGVIQTTSSYVSAVVD